MEIFLSICLGIGLSASAGFRVFIPLLLFSIAGYLDWVTLAEDWSWMGSLTAVIVLGVAAVVEVLAYYIPYVDNALDSISVPLATLAGVAMTISVIGDMDPIYSWTLAIIAGGGTAATISSTTSVARAASTGLTGGLGNPVISTVEAGMSSALSVLSMFMPLVAVIIVFLLLIGMRKLYKRLFPNKHSTKELSDQT